MKGSIFGYLDDSNGNGRLSGDLARHEEWTSSILPADAGLDTFEGDTNRRPLMIFMGIVTVAVVVLLTRLMALQIVGGDHNLRLANGNRIRETVSRAPRGMILDRNKTILARNQASFDVTVVPQQLPATAAERQLIYARIGSLTHASAQSVQTLAEADCKVSKIDCLGSPVPKLVVSGITREQALLVDQASPSLPGFALDVNPIREYSDGGLLSVFLGYTGRVDSEEAASDPSYGPIDLIGKLGIESSYEAVLRGQNGGQRTEVDATGKPVRVLASREAIAGDNVILSIDQGLEQKFAAAISKQMQLSGAKRASGVAINPKTGEILAAVSLPSYDNNLFSGGISQADYSKLVNDPAQPLFNKVTSGAYPTGSIIKPLIASGALEEKIISTTTTIDDKGKLVVVNKYDPSIVYTFNGWEHSGLGIVNIYTAIARSSDIFFFTIAGGFTNFTHYLGVDKLTDYYHRFGLGSKTGVDIPNETAGRVPTPDWKKKTTGEDWFTGDTYNIAVGQGDILASPLQMATAIASIANGGILYKPHFVSRIEDTKGNLVRQINPEITRRDFISQDNLKIVRDAMRQTVTLPQGTACCFMDRDVPVAVAGKTGSAETDPINNIPPHSWFVSFAPFDNPQIVTVVLLEKAGEGAEYAVPATRETLQWYFTQGAGANIR
jgi:penicillin-binding protein 2